jgi:catechol 2,3-dioxygenase-like lactoylglutathione lyase family enzyme
MAVAGVEVILYVSSQATSRAFYRLALGRDPVLDVPGMTSFDLGGGCRIGLMPEADAAELLGSSVPVPSSARGVPRAELYLLVDDLGSACARVLDAGGEQVSPPATRPWGDRAAYFLDPDGHVLAVAERGERP